MTRSLKQKPRLGDPKQPLPERHVYVEKAKKQARQPTRHAVELSDSEVQHIRAAIRSGAVRFTVAAEFSVPSGEIRDMTVVPFKLRCDVPRVFETPAQTEDRQKWLASEIEAAHWHALILDAYAEDKEWTRRRDARRVEVDAAWKEAKREDRKRSRAASKTRKAVAP